MTPQEIGQLLNLMEVGEATGRNFILSKKSDSIDKVTEENIHELVSKKLITKIRDGKAGQDQYMITDLGMRVRSGEAEV